MKIFPKIHPKLNQVVNDLALIFVILLVVYNVIAYLTFDPNRKTVFGITYSKQYATSLGLDWRQTYLTLLDELKIKYVRIPTYWEEVESKQGIYDFKDVDWQIQELGQRGGKAVLVVGMRQPRWPECHNPDWEASLSVDDRKQKIRELIAATVNHFKDQNAIEAWQVENEPLLNLFGKCPDADPQFLQEEIQLVKAIDSRPIVVTGSGELALWFREARWADILGSTMYRTTWNKYLGYGTYWFIPASSYRVKAWLFGHHDLNTFWISELQAEPWIPSGEITKTDLNEQYKSMSPQLLQKSVDYSVKANAARVYLWGAEWWYYAKTKLNAPEIWETVKKINW